MIKKQKPTRPDTMEDVTETDIIQMSRSLLEAYVDATGVFKITEMTPESLKNGKLLLGFLNATRNAVNTRMQIFKLVGLDDKMDAIRDRAKSN